MENTPHVFVDKVCVLVDLPHMNLVFGRYTGLRTHNNRFQHRYRWINVTNGKVGVCSHFRRSIFVEYNPSTLEFGHNIFPYADSLLESVPPIVSAAIRKTPGLDLARRHSILLRGGHSRLSEIHLAADYLFPTDSAMTSFMRNLRRSWNWRRHRKGDDKKDRYDTSRYIAQTTWTFIAYDKGAEVEQDSNRTLWVKMRARKTFRFEIRIQRRDLRKLGHRLQQYYPGLGLLDLSHTYDWQPHIYTLVYDFYMARIRSIHRHAREDAEAVPLYRFLAKHGAVPVNLRTTSCE